LNTSFSDFAFGLRNERYDSRMSDKPKSADGSVSGAAVRATVSLAAAAGVGPLLSLRADFPDWVIAIWVGAGFLVALAISLQIVKVVLDHRRDVAAANFRVQLRDALLPVTGVVSDMNVGAHFEVRREQLRTAAQATTGALYQLVSPHSSRVRANVFWVEESGNLVWLAHSGRGERPGPFVRGTERGDAVFEFLARLRPEFFPNLKKRKPEGWEGTMEGYSTFVAVPIWSTGKVFGMLTIDSPKAKSLVLEDQYILEMFSEVMTLAFEKGLHESESTE
jgi:transcriptional regulator with GAF, ATPase, and Fis domain